MNNFRLLIVFLVLLIAALVVAKYDNNYTMSLFVAAVSGSMVAAVVYDKWVKDYIEDA